MKKPSEAERLRDAKIRRLYDKRHVLLTALRDLEGQIDRLELEEQAALNPALRGGR